MKIARPYQEEMTKFYIRSMDAGKNPLGVLPTGTGKTFPAARVAQHYTSQGYNTLFMVRGIDLVDQAYAAMCEQLGEENVCLEMAQSRAYLRPEGRMCVVASKDTLQGRRLSMWPRDAFHHVFTDECFPAGTDINGTPIEKIRLGDEVMSYNPITGKFTKRFVTELRRRNVGWLVRVNAGGKDVVCTPNHPFYTNRGWVAAERLTSNHWVATDPDMLQLHNNLRANQTSEGCVGSQRKNEGVLLQKMLVADGVQKVIRSDGSHQSQVRFGAHEGEKSDGEAGDTRASVFVAEGNGSQTLRPWWKRQAAVRPTASATGTPWRRLGAGASDSDRQRQVQRRVSDVLQSGLGDAEPEVVRGSGRQLSLPPQASGAGPQEGSVPCYHRVDSVEILEPGSDGTFGGLCPDGFVYNFAVDGTHTYLANGFVVHNCHHSVASGYLRIFDHFSAARRAGCTATNFRSDKVNLSAAGFDDQFCPMTLLEAISQGWLVPLRQYFVPIHGLDLSKLRTPRNKDGESDFTDKDIAGFMQGNEIPLGIVKATLEKAAGRPTLLFAPDVASAAKFATLFNAERPGCAEYIASYRIGEDESRETDMQFDDQGRPINPNKEFCRLQKKRFCAGDLQVLIAVGMCLEGTDLPPAAVLANARPTKSTQLLAQMVGRVTRTLTGTIDDLAFAMAHDRMRAIALSSKPFSDILDFVGVAGKHNVAQVADLLFGDMEKEYLDQIRAEMQRTADPVQAQKNVYQKLCDLANAAALKAQAKIDDTISRADQLRRHVAQNSTVHYSLHSIPLGHSEDRLFEAEEQRPVSRATPNQQKLLRHFGVSEEKIASIRSPGQAGAILDSYTSKSAPTPWQRRTLTEAGLPVPTTYKEARAALKRIGR